MVLDDGDLMEDSSGGGKAAAVSCSICLDVVTDNGSRSRAKLRCGHEFHLDCIGSAFNAKGAMQCPNCRETEKGQWLYGSGNRPLLEFNMDDWAHDEDLYDLSYSEMPFEVHWCPYGGLTSLPSSFDQRELNPSAFHTDHNLIGHHTLFTEHTAAVSSATNPCPYIAYIGPIHPLSSNFNISVSSDGTNYNNPRNNNPQPVPSEVQPTSYHVPTIDGHLHSWEHQHPSSATFPSTSSRISGVTDQPPVPSIMTHRTARPNSDIHRPGAYAHPFVVGHRAGSSITSSVIPYRGSDARARERIQALEAYYQQNTNSLHMHTPSLLSTNRRPSPVHRGLAQPPPPVSPEQPNGFYFFPSSSSTSRNFSEPENHSQPSQFHVWDPPVEADQGPEWGSFHQPGGGGSNTNNIRPSGYQSRHGQERKMQSHNRS